MKENIYNEYENSALKKPHLTMIELFSGIGAQKFGTDLTNLFNCEVIATADIEKDAMLSYAAIHNGLTNEMIKNFSNYPSEEIMREELTKKNIGFDFKKKTNPINRLKGEKLKKYYLAMLLSNNLGDISKIDKLPLADFWTYSFPCQDISLAGKQAGIVKGQTRSGLLYEVERLLDIAKNTNTLPKYLLLENVKNLVGKRFKNQFDDWINRLDELGFNTYWSVVNAKNCGIPQNRERVFALSIRKDIDTGLFKFMKPFDSGFRLKDFLENSVDDKYYLSPEVQNRLQITDKTFTKNVIGTTKPEYRTIGQRDLVYQENSVMGSLVATDYKQPKQIVTGIDKSANSTRAIEYANCITSREDRGVSNRKAEGTAVLEQVGQIYGTLKESNPQAGRIYSETGLSPTIDSCSGGNRMPKIVQRQRGYNKGGEHENCTSITSHSWECNNFLKEKNIKIRKLTPKECWRLMGFSDECFEKAVAVGVSDSAGYKQAGNSIVTYCIKGIMEHLYKAQYDNSYICFDENFIKPQAD